MNDEVSSEHIHEDKIVYVNTIDIFIDHTLDLLSDITNNINNSKVGMNTNDVIKSYDTFAKKLNYNQIDDFIENLGTRTIVKNIVNDYIIIYLYLSLAFNNNIQKIRELLMESMKKVKGSLLIFMSDVNNISLLVKYSSLIIDILEIIHNIDDIAKIKNIHAKTEAINIINFLGYDYVNEQLIKNKKTSKHNILKIIIFRMIYLMRDKTNIFKLIEEEELSKAEFTYIDIVDSLVEELDYATIEKLFSGDAAESNLIEVGKRGVAELMFDMYISSQDQSDEQTSTDHKIQELYTKNILIPITDEFLRFHKNSERYEKNVGLTKIDVREKTNKKDNTKIRYIVTKINKLIDYYSIVKKGNKNAVEEVDKLLYPSMNYRKAVIINEFEELSIINKMMNQGKRVTDSNEYYSDLVNFRAYPYVNFKDFDKYGFNFKFDNTKLAIRYCNFEFKDAEQYPAQYNGDIQVRVASKDTYVNIVGAALNPIAITNKLRNLGTSSCVKLQNTMQIEKNGYIGMLRALKHQIKNEVGYTKLLYWIFDKNTDKVKMSSYENLAALNSEEYFKFMMSKLHDELIVMTYEKIIDVINSMDAYDYRPSIYELKMAIENVQEVLLDITGTSYYNSVLKHMYLNKGLVLNVTNFDKNENKIPGLNSTLLQIPTYKNTDTKQNIIIIKKKEFLTGEKEEEYNEILETAYCQHQVTWNAINMYKKRSPNKFNQALSEFIQKYVIDNKDKEYICKSCHQYVDVKKYIYDSFTSSVSNIALTVSLEADLESIPEYEKFSKAIKNMDKIVEKMAYISGIQYYVGNTPTNKYHRQDVIKNTIDLILVQFATFDTANINMRKERLESSNKLYGVSKELSNYFIFDMDNNLFTYSSKDVDKFKRYKNNNILAYFIFMMICDLSHGQIMQLTYDKLINYEIFDKFAINLFNGLYIRINNGNDVKPIINYKLLCYIIYNMSGMLLKYNYWYVDKNQVVNKPNSINPLLHKVIIHTIIDLINSILEVNTRKNKNYIYDSISTKFLSKLVKIYDDKQVDTKDAIDRLISISDKKIQIVGTKIKIKSKDANMIRKLDDYTVIGQSHKFGLNTHKMIPGKYYINTFNKKIVLTDIIDDARLEAINKKSYIATLEKIYKNFGDDGSRLAKTRAIGTDKKQLQTHAENILKIQLNKIATIELNKKQKETFNNNMQQYNHESYDAFKKQDDLQNKADVLIELMEKSIGKNININNANIYLKKTVFIVDHDHVGNMKKEPLIFFDDENKMEFKKNDKFFETDIYYYVDKSKNITIYYDANELYLLGYREMNKEYERVKGVGKYLKINYSIKTKLMLLGHSHVNYKFDMIDEESDKIMIISDILRKRIHNLKNIVKEFQSMIYQIKNKVVHSGSNVLVKQFSDKLKDLHYYDDGNKIFDNWKATIDEIYFNTFKSNLSIEMHGNYLHASKMLKYNNNDVIIMHYLIEQIMMFLSINQNNSKLTMVIALIINQLFDRFNIDELIYHNDEVRKYSLLKTTTTSYVDNNDTFDMANLTDDTISAEDENMTDEQKQQLEEQREDNRETDEGMDTDINMGDDMDEGDEGMDMIRNVEDAD